MTIAPDTKVAISFTQAEWQHVVNVLSERPFKEVAGMIASLQQQFEAAVKADAPAPQAENPSE